MANLRVEQHGNSFVLKSDINADRARSLPRGRLELTVYVAEGRPRIQAAYLAIADARKSRSTDPLALDDGAVVVDYDSETGALAGLEMLDLRASSAELPELARHIAKTRNALLLCMISTMTLQWLVVERVLTALAALDGQALRSLAGNTQMQRRIARATLGDKPTWHGSGSGSTHRVAALTAGW